MWKNQGKDLKRRKQGEHLEKQEKEEYRFANKQGEINIKFQVGEKNP